MRKLYFYKSWLYSVSILLYYLLIAWISLFRSFLSFVSASNFCSNYYCFFKIIFWQVDWLDYLTCPSKESHTWFIETYISSINSEISYFYLPYLFKKYPLISFILDLSSFIFLYTPSEIKSPAESSNWINTEFSSMKNSFIFYFTSFSKSIWSLQYLCTFVIAYFIIFFELSSTTFLILFLSWVLFKLWPLEYGECYKFTWFFKGEIIDIKLLVGIFLGAGSNFCSNIIWEPVSATDLRVVF